MKIACQSCQAKYTIADEKVVGKVVKIRCKKCGSTIVVNGQEGGQGGGDGGRGSVGGLGDEPTEVRGSSADINASAEAWTVNVADDDQRTMTSAQVAAEFARGTVNDETYCWRDGMGDWLPLREIEELASACGLHAASGFAQPAPAAPHSQPPRAAAEPPRAATMASPVRSPSSVRPAGGGGGGGLAGIFGASSGTGGTGGLIANGPASQPPPQFGGSSGGVGAAAARRAGGRAGGADLFGAAAEAGGENDVMTSAPQNAGASSADADGKMTGQRNENSVLFSLNALTSTDKAVKPGGLAGAAEGDGSGLIDIRALSSSMGTTGPKKTNHADDIMNLGGGGAFSAALAAPVLTAPPLDSSEPGAAGGSSNKKLLLMFAALAALIVVGLVGVFFMLQPKSPAVATATPEGSGAPTSTSPGASTAGTAPAAVAPPAADTSTAAAAAPAPAPVADNTPKASAPSVGVRHGGSSAPTNHETTSFIAPTPAPPPPTPPSGGSDSLEKQMARAGGGGGAPPPPAVTGSSNPFDRGAAQAALGGIADGVSSCKKPGGPTGDGHVSITFSPAGGVVSAIVDQPPFAGTAVGGCVAGKFRGAHVPAFAGGNLTIGKRFSVN